MLTKINIVTTKNILVYIHTYAYPKSCISQIWPEKFRTL